MVPWNQEENQALTRGKTTHVIAMEATEDVVVRCSSSIMLTWASINYKVYRVQFGGKQIKN